MRSILRRRYLVRSFQYRLILFQAVYIALLCGTVYFLGVAPLVRKVQEGGLVPGRAVDSARSLMAFDRNVLPVLLPLAVLAFAHAVVVSHRIAGPLYRFSAVFRSIATGDLSMRVRIRPRDYLQEEAREFDQAVASVRERIAHARARAGTLAEELERLGQRLPDGSSVAEAQVALRELEEALAGFRLEREAAPGHEAQASKAA